MLLASITHESVYVFTLLILNVLCVDSNEQETVSASNLYIYYLGKTTHATVGRIALTMCLAAASGGITQCIVSGLVQMYNRHEHFNTNEIANAVLANLVAVTGCCSFVQPQWAILIGREYRSWHN